MHYLFNYMNPYHGLMQTKEKQNNRIPLELDEKARKSVAQTKQRVIQMEKNFYGH